MDMRTQDLPAVPRRRDDPEMDNFVYEGKQGRGTDESTFRRRSGNDAEQRPEHPDEDERPPKLTQGR